VANVPKPEALVVEDEPLIRMAAADAISEIGITMREAGDSSEALKLLDEYPRVSLLFTDLELPGDMNGLALAEQFHDIRPDVELIVTSGANSLSDRDLPDDGTFLPKPYRAERLREVVRMKFEAQEG
jgi:DNA-binding NtrC family response regulator